MHKPSKKQIQMAVFDSFILFFCYGLLERISAIFADGFSSKLELGQLTLVLLLLTMLCFLNPRNYAN